MKQAYFEVKNYAIDITAATPGLDEAARELVKTTGGYEAATDSAPSTDARRFALLPGKNGQRALLQTVPVSGSRKGFSFTHALIIEANEDIHTADLLRGWDDTFWQTAAGSDVKLPAVRAVPWTKRREYFDARLTDWASEPNRQRLVAAVLRAVLATGPQPPTVYVAAEPEDVFWAAYAAARLLPKAAAERLTFSTHEVPITSREARLVVGGLIAPGSLPPLQCQTRPNVWIDLAAPSRAEFETEQGGYADTVLLSWLGSREKVDGMLEKAAHVDDANTLEIWLRITCRPETVTDEELTALSADPFWQQQIIRSAGLLRRVLAANTKRGAQLVRLAPQQVALDLVDLLAAEVADAVRRQRPDFVQRLLYQAAGCPEAVEQRLATVVADGSPALDSGTWLLLAGWLGIERIDAPVLANDVAGSQAIPDVREDLAPLIAKWALRADRQLRDKGYPALVANPSVWNEVCKYLTKRGADAATFLEKLCSLLTRDLAAQADLCGLLSTLVAVHVKDASKLTKTVRQAQLIADPDLLLAVAAAKANLSDDLCRAMAGGVLSDKSASAIVDKNLRETLLKFLPKADGLQGPLALRWSALRTMPQLGKQTPEEAAQLLGQLIDWNAKRVFDSPGEMNGKSLASVVLRNVCVAATDASLDTLRNWYRLLGPIWTKAGRRFWPDFLTALAGWPHDHDRRLAMVQAVWLADDVTTLQRDTEVWLNKLTEADREAVGAIIRDQLEKRYVNRLILTGPLQQKPPPGLWKRFLQVFRSVLLIAALAVFSRT